MGVAILQKIRYNTCMKKHLARIVLDIEDLAGVNLKLDKAQNSCKIGLSDIWGGGAHLL